MPLGFLTGRNLVFGYDPSTGKLSELKDEAGTYNLATIMGGAEVVFELNMMLDDERWQKLWLQYCRLYNAPRNVLEKDMRTGASGHGRFLCPRRSTRGIRLHQDEKRGLRASRNQFPDERNSRPTSISQWSAKSDGPRNHSPRGRVGLSRHQLRRAKRLGENHDAGNGEDHLPAELPLIDPSKPPVDPASEARVKKKRPAVSTASGE